MPIDNVFQGEVFTVRIYKQYVGFAWANTYEVQATIDIPNPITAIEALASNLVTLERSIHLQGVIIDRVIVSTYVPDAQPYNPATFTSIPISLSGQRTPVGEVLPLELCMFVRRDAQFGRDGKLLYRGCLTENDMFAAAFRPLLTSSARSSLQASFATWLSGTGLPSGFQLVMARGAPAPTNVRLVNGLLVSEKIAVKKLNNRYFDRP